jgi:hypothetical protein
MQGNERQLTDVVSDTRRLLALFDSLADAPFDTSVTTQMHDETGVVVKTLKLWAHARNFTVAYQRNHLEGGAARSWDSYDVNLGPGRCITVHDATSRVWAESSSDVENVGGEWSPAQAVAS